MGKKINPKIFRMGITRTWPSIWFKAGQAYIRNVEQDVKIRKFLIEELKEAGIDKVDIKRNANQINIDIYTAKPGMIIGRGGSGVDDLRKKIHCKFLSRPSGIRLNNVNININEVTKPNLSAQIVLQSMILDIEKRMPFRKVMKQAISRVERVGALGVKVIMGGRLNGAEIARSEKLIFGKVPLHTLRANIDYASGTGHTTYGAIGIKIWIYKGDIFEKELKKGEVI